MAKLPSLRSITDLIPGRDERSDELATRTDAVGTDGETGGVYDRAALESDSKFGSAVIGGLDKALQIQTSTITKYVDGLRKKNPEASVEQLQGIIDKHFLNIVQGTGAGAGAAAAIPGVGLVMGTAAIGAESLVFIEAAAWYILASAHSRGIDVHDAEVRRAIVLLVLTGSKGSALVDTFIQDMGAGATANLSTAKALTRFSAPTLSGLNGRLTRMFLKNITKRMRWAWVSKLMPLGIGAVLGTMANRKLGQQVIKHTHEQLPQLT